MPQRKPTQRKSRPQKQRYGSSTPPSIGPSLGTNGRATHAKNGNRKPKKVRSANGSLEAESHSNTLLTRRGFLYGALGVGAVAVVGAGAAAAVAITDSQEEEEEITVLEVPETEVTNIDEFGNAEKSNDHVSLVQSINLPFGSLVWANSSSIAACLLPTEESASPLTQAAILSLTSGDYSVVLEQAVGQEDGYDIYDIRANTNGIVWTEANIFRNTWRIYAATYNEGSMGEPILLDEGDNEWETPTLVASATSAFWQVLPSLSGTHTAEDSLLKRARFGSANVETIYSSTGRMSTPPYGLENRVVITPRTNTSRVHHQLTLLDSESGDVLDKVVLPAGMKPLEAGYTDNGFTFSFEGSYDYGEGIADMGTYTPMAAATPQNYNGLEWFHFARVPSAAPAWCGKYLIVKSLTSVIGVDLASNTYFAIDVETGSETYGDYLATTGIHDRFVTYTGVDYKPLKGSAQHYCLVRVWEPISE